MDHCNVKFGTEDSTKAPLLHAKFYPRQVTSRHVILSASLMIYRFLFLCCFFTFHLFCIHISYKIDRFIIHRFIHSFVNLVFELSVSH